MISRELFTALLSLDSYNRGYGTNLIDLGEAGQIGNANIRAFELGEQRGWQDAGFYAIAYDVSGVAGFADGERVISYRGTNFNFNTSSVEAFLQSPAVVDAANGWIVGAGVPGGQANFAIDFYRAVVGDANDPFNANITTTGHSLGGGLAGYVGALYGASGILFDNMPFAAANDNFQKSRWVA